MGSMCSTSSFPPFIHSLLFAVCNPLSFSHPPFFPLPLFFSGDEDRGLRHGGSCFCSCRQFDKLTVMQMY